MSDLFSVIWNFFVVIFAIGCLGVAIGAAVVGMYWFLLFYLFFAAFLFLFCRW